MVCGRVIMPALDAYKPRRGRYAAAEVLLVCVTAAVASIGALSAAAAHADRPAAGTVEHAGSEKAAAGITEWPLFRGVPQATGRSDGEIVPPLREVWKKTVPDGSFQATAVIADGVVYVGDLDGRFYALSLADGEPRWTFTAPVGFSAAAAVAGDKLWIGDLDGTVYALDAHRGELLWKFQTEAEINGGANLRGEQLLIGSQDASLYCLESSGGKLLWTYTTDDQIRCFPTTVGGRGFLAGCDARLHVVDLDGGQAIAGVPLDAQTGCTPAVLGKSVYFGTEGGTFFCVDWEKAQIRWESRSPQSGQPIRSSAAVDEGIVVYGGRDKRLRALNPESGEELWTFSARGRIDASPVLAGESIVVGSADGRLYLIDRHSGKAVWQFDAGGTFSASAAVASGRVVVGNEDGVLYCFAAEK
jgi:outer membrane protein assembly factor BamB